MNEEFERPYNWTSIGSSVTAFSGESPRIKTYLIFV